MKLVFKNNNLNKSFNKNGYVILKNVVSCDFKILYNYFNNLNANVNGKFYASLWSKDRVYREKVDTDIKKQLEPIIKTYLSDYSSFFGDLLVKKPSWKHRFDWHQDWTFVDEEFYSSVFIWCPLQNVNKRNGCLQVLPGSHTKYNSLRGSNIAPKQLDAEFYEDARKNSIYLELNKGDVVIFNQALFHASPPNRTFKNRLAIGLLAIPNNVPIYHYHLNIESNKIEKYKIDFNFIMDYSSNQNFIKNLHNMQLKRPTGGTLIKQ